jgi:hypothetical protein
VGREGGAEEEGGGHQGLGGVLEEGGENPAPERKGGDNVIQDIFRWGFFLLFFCTGLLKGEGHAGEGERVK